MLRSTALCKCPGACLRLAIIWISIDTQRRQRTLLMTSSEKVKSPNRLASLAQLRRQIRLNSLRQSDWVGIALTTWLTLRTQASSPSLHMTQPCLGVPTSLATRTLKRTWSSLRKVSCLSYLTTRGASTHGLTTIEPNRTDWQVKIGVNHFRVTGFRLPCIHH